jgi:protein arginine kinase
MTQTEDIINQTTSSLWHKSDLYSDTVFLSRTVLKRNHAELPFREHMGDDNRLRLINDMLRIKGFTHLPEKFQSAESSTLERGQISLLEESEILNHGESPDAFLPGNEYGLSVVINGNSHIAITVVSGNSDFVSALSRSESVDKTVNEHIPYAFSDRLGFLFPNPAECGLGLDLMAIMHIPSLATLKCYPEIKRICDDMKLSLAAYPDEYEAETPLFCKILSRNEPANTEIESARKLQSAISMITDLERDAREEYYHEFKPHIDDAVWRSLGILRHSRMIGYREAFEYLSHIRLGILLSIIKGFSLTDLNGLFFKIRRSHLHLYSTEPITTQLEADQVRATLLRSYFQGATSVQSD